MTNGNGTKRRMTKAELDNRANQLNPNNFRYQGKKYKENRKLPATTRKNSVPATSKRNSVPAVAKRSSVPAGKTRKRRIYNNQPVIIKVVHQHVTVVNKQEYVDKSFHLF